MDDKSTFRKNTNPPLRFNRKDPVAGYYLTRNGHFLKFSGSSIFGEFVFINAVNSKLHLFTRETISKDIFTLKVSEYDYIIAHLPKIITICF